MIIAVVITLIMVLAYRASILNDRNSEMKLIIVLLSMGMFCFLYVIANVIMTVFRTLFGI